LSILSAAERLTKRVCSISHWDFALPTDTHYTCKIFTKVSLSKVLWDIISSAYNILTKRIQHDTCPGSKRPCAISKKPLPLPKINLLLHSYFLISACPSGIPYTQKTESFHNFNPGVSIGNQNHTFLLLMSILLGICFFPSQWQLYNIHASRRPPFSSVYYISSPSINRSFNICSIRRSNLWFC
jgi:hypothetical protein